jgi:hypothetical protein
MSMTNRPAVVMETMEQRMLFDASALTETIISKTLPASVSRGAPLTATVTIQISNDSGVTQSGPAEVGVFIADGVLSIPSGDYGILGSKHIDDLAMPTGTSKTEVVPIKLKADSLAIGTDTLFALVVDPTGAWSQSAAEGNLVVTRSLTPAFSDSILKATPKYTVTGTTEFTKQLDMEMAIEDTGALSSGNDGFTLYASPSSTFDSSATEIGHVVLNLKVIHNGLRKFFINFNTANVSNSAGTAVDDYIFVKVLDTAGDATLASFPTVLQLAGPVA